MTRSAAASSRRLLFTALALTLAPVPARAQPPAPAPPPRFDVALRYRITSARDQHVAEYDEMVEQLKRQGFEFTPPLENLPESDREDRTKNLLTGTVAPGNVLKLLDSLHVQTLLLTRPELRKAPPAPAARVKVRLELAGGFPTARQRELANQARVLLGTLGFVEAVGYDNRGYTGRPHTRLVGTVPTTTLLPIPAALLATVPIDDIPTPVLLGDLRDQPGGWLGAHIAREDLPMPLRLVNPITVIEVLPDPAPPKELPPPPPRAKGYLYKITPDLWAVAGAKDKANDVVRMEVILAYTPGPLDTGWRDPLLAAAPSAFVEGRMGPVVTLLARAGQAAGLAALPIVSTVRFPPLPLMPVAPGIKTDGDNARALRESGLERLHKQGFRGVEQLCKPGYRKTFPTPVRIAILDTDFTGYEELVKAKRLPAGTRYVDMTVERSYDLLPEPPFEKGTGPGHGARCALAAALAAPEAELVLVRVDPTTPYQLREVADYINGQLPDSEYLTQRRGELATEAAVLRIRRRELQEERQRALENYEDERDFEREYGILGAAADWLFSPRRWHAKRVEEYEREVAAYRVREVRYLELMKGLQSLRGVQFVSCPLVWPDGYPVSSNSALSRWFAELPRPCFLWFQAAGNTEGQSWTGLFHDADGNGAMEFAPHNAALPLGRWTRELNFLAWRPYEGKTEQDLPAGARIRLSLQWREPHDPTLFFRPGAPDLYRTPLAELRLLVLRQRDPDGKLLPADDFEVVGRAEGLPQRLDNQPNASTYELVVEFTVAKAGRYAVRVERQVPTRWVIISDPKSGREGIGVVEGLTPTGIRPVGVATLPEVEKNWELRPRLFVRAVDDKVGREGRPVLGDFATSTGTIGMPADSRGVVTIGAAGFDNRPEPYSAKGPPANLEFFVCPQALAYDRLQFGVEPPGVAFGTSLATPFAAGLAASLRSAGVGRDEFLRLLCQRPGAVLVAPRRP
jgi:hypothetical protein